MKWWIVPLAALSVAPIASAQVVTVSQFLLGKWTLGCSATAVPGGVTMLETGKMIGHAGDWGCVITSMKETRPRWHHKGPYWDFTANCDQTLDRPRQPGAFNGAVRGSMWLLFPPQDKYGNLALHISIDRPPRSGETGIWALYTSERYGPYIQCEQ